MNLETQLTKTLAKIIEDMNSISKNVWSGSIQKDDNDSYYLLLNSLPVHAVVEVDLSFKQIKLIFNFYHKKLDINSLGETNLFKGYSNITAEIKYQIKSLQEELKKL